MSCFGATPTTPAYYASPSSYASSSSGRPWRWWRARCAGIAAAVGARLRRSLSLHKRMGRWGTKHGRRRHKPYSSLSAVHHHHHHAHHHRRSGFFAPVYVDDLYAHHQYPSAADAVVVQAEPTTSGTGAKLAAPVHAHAADASPVVFVPAAAGAARVGAATTGKSAAAAAATIMRPPKPSRDVVALLRSPGRGAVVKGMGEVDLRAELFIRKFKEDMRLQSQRSAEELQAMLARGL